MSANLSQIIYDYIEQEVTEYIRKISVDYNLNFNELVMKWKGESSSDNVCPHRYTKGKMVGQRCTQKIHEGETKCSKHKIRNKPFLNEDVKIVNELNDLTITELEHSDYEGL